MAMYGPPQGPPQGPPFGPVQASSPMGPPPAKKKSVPTGCIVAIVVVMLFFGTIGAVVLAIGYRVSQDKDVQNVFGALGDATEVMLEAQSAPGTAELRAIGCEQAFAIDPTKMAKIAGRFADAGAPPPRAAAGAGRIVMCQVGAFGAAPTCDDAARAYAAGAAPSKNFMLSVQQQGKAHQCNGFYSPAGVLLSAGGAALP